MSFHQSETSLTSQGRETNFDAFLRKIEKEMAQNGLMRECHDMILSLRQDLQDAQDANDIPTKIKQYIKTKVEETVWEIHQREHAATFAWKQLPIWKKWEWALYERLAYLIDKSDRYPLGKLKQYKATAIDPSVLPGPTPLPKTRIPSILIVTPSFQQGDFIEKTIKSVLDQDYPHLTYIVQDGGSKDTTLDVLKKYDGRIIWESQKDMGQSNAINLGFAKGRGDIMAYLNSDDLLTPYSLNIVANFFEKHPNVDMVYGNRIIMNECDLEIGRWYLPSHNESEICYCDYIPQETMFWRREIWEKAGGTIDESFHFAMDWDLIMRFAAAGATIRRIPIFLGCFRVHTKQKTTSQMILIGEREMARIRRNRFGGHDPLHKKICFFSNKAKVRSFVSRYLNFYQ